MLQFSEAAAAASSARKVGMTALQPARTGAGMAPDLYAAALITLWVGCCADV